jgi:hypothetical protein
MSHFAFLEDYNRSVKSAHRVHGGLAKSISRFMSSLSNAELQRQIQKKLLELGPEIEQRRKNHYGVLVRVDVDSLIHNEVGTSTPFLQQVSIVAAAGNVQDAKRQAAAQAYMRPTICPVRPGPFCKTTTGYLWFTPFGMEVH